MNDRFDDGDAGRDDLMEHLLAQRSVPEHGPRFWADLQKAMVDGTDAVSRSRDPRFGARLVGAAAMIAMVAGAGVLLMSRAGQEPVTTSAGPPSTSAAATVPATDGMGVASSEATATTIDAATTAEMRDPSTSGTPTSMDVSTTEAESTLPSDVSTTSPPGGLVSTTLGPPVTIPALYGGPQPGPGERLSVVGMQPEEQLDVRIGPSPGYGVVGRVGAGETVGVTGEAVLDYSGLWFRIQEFDNGADGGWLPAANLAAEGAPLDVTDELDEIVSTMSGDVPRSEVLAFLAAVRRPDHLMPALVVDDGPLGVTLDLYVLDVQEMVAAGERLFVLLVQEEDGSWAVLDAEAVPLCSRGVDPSGACR